MKPYIVTFKSDNPDPIINVIKSFSGWGRITETVWVINSYQNASAIRDALAKAANTADTIFVVKSGTEAAWRNTPASNDWLRKNL